MLMLGLIGFRTHAKEMSLRTLRGVLPRTGFQYCTTHDLNEAGTFKNEARPFPPNAGLRYQDR